MCKTGVVAAFAPFSFLTVSRHVNYISQLFAIPFMIFTGLSVFSSFMSLVASLADEQIEYKSKARLLFWASSNIIAPIKVVLVVRHRFGTPIPFPIPPFTRVDYFSLLEHLRISLKLIGLVSLPGTDNGS